ncbi:hypothetical protein EVAR_9114_1 [Eumeta japonica]|uniref:Uncharacterized protein n=1 Tax=Eumeta variegata TaxID=151549 RepID=A0A4C1TW59_EUMVA|nr:hypothetical protein EVAR_9114_1 [Eumeta japonica]
MSIYYALAGWSGNRERRDERTKRKREKEKAALNSHWASVEFSRAKPSQSGIKRLWECIDHQWGDNLEQPHKKQE